MSRVKYQDRSPSESLPSPFTSDDLARVEEALRQLATAKALIARCERCKVPVTEAKSDAEAVEAFLQAVLSEFRGPQSPIGV